MIQYEEMIKNINILLVDDDDDYLTMTTDFLTTVGYNINVAKNGVEALDIFSKKDYQIILLDYFMPGMTGEQVVEEIRKTNQEVIIILQTGFSGQNPPVETLKRLNIQNYHDKTEGIDRLNLEIISAVRVFMQQYEIEISNYRANAIGKLMAGVAQEIKNNLLSVGAGLEATNMLISTDLAKVNEQDLEKVNKFYSNNKNSLERIDKVLTSIISQSREGVKNVTTDKDIVDIITLIVKNDLKIKEINFVPKIALKANSYITAKTSDIIFIICEIIRNLTLLGSKGDTIEFTLTEDENNWFFDVSSEIIDSKMSNTSIQKIIKIANISGVNLQKKVNSLETILEKNMEL